MDAYRHAVAHLADLEVAVAAKRDHEAVLEGLTALKIAVVRAYDGRRPRAVSGDGGRARILRYLQERPGVWVYGEELAAVSGIGEWARRVRELRVEHGYFIEERAGVYRL